MPRAHSLPTASPNTLPASDHLPTGCPHPVHRLGTSPHPTRPVRTTATDRYFFELLFTFLGQGLRVQERFVVFSQGSCLPMVTRRVLSLFLPHKVEVTNPWRPHRESGNPSGHECIHFFIPFHGIIKYITLQEGDPLSLLQYGGRVSGSRTHRYRRVNTRWRVAILSTQTCRAL